MKNNSYTSQKIAVTHSRAVGCVLSLFSTSPFPPALIVTQSLSLGGGLGGGALGPSSAPVDSGCGILTQAVGVHFWR